MADELQNEDQTGAYLAHRQDSETRAAMEDVLGKDTAMAIRWAPTKKQPPEQQPAADAKPPSGEEDQGFFVSPFSGSIMPMANAQKTEDALAGELPAAASFAKDAFVDAPRAGVAAFGGWAKSSIKLWDTVGKSIADRAPADPAITVDGLVDDPVTGPRIQSHFSNTSEMADIRKTGNFSRLVPQWLKTFEGPKSTAGTIEKDIAQFGLGLWSLHKTVLGSQLAKLGELGAAGTVAKGSTEAALVNFTAFDAHEKNLFNTLQELGDKYPTLKGPISDAMAASPSDTEYMGRAKRAVEGLVVGIPTEVLIEGMKSLRGLRTVRDDIFAGGSKGAEEAAPKIEKISDPERVKDLLSDDLAADIANKRAVAMLDARSARRAQIALQEGMAESADQVGDILPGDLLSGAHRTDKFPINWDHINTTEDAETVMQSMADANEQGLYDARGGKTQPLDAIKHGSLEEDGYLALLDERYKHQGNILGATKTLAARQVYHRAGAKLRQLASIAASTERYEDVYAFRRMMVVYDTVQKSIMAIRSDQARALNAWKIDTGAWGDKVFSKQLDAMLEASGGMKNTLDLAQKVANLEGRALNHVVEHGIFARSQEAIKQIYINGLLSSPRTAIKKGLSDLTMAPINILSRFVAEAIGGGAADGVAQGEAWAYAVGSVQGIKDGFRAASKKVLGGKAAVPSAASAGEQAMTGKSSGSVIQELFDKSLLDPEAEKYIGYAKGQGRIVEAYHRGGALSAESLGVSQNTKLGAAVDLMDVATRSPSRLIGMADEFAKSVTYRAELHAQAWRKATRTVNAADAALQGTAEQIAERAGTRADRIQEEMARLLADPSETNIRVNAAESAIRSTFTAKPDKSLNSIFGGFRDGLNGMVPGLGTYVLPFLNTPMNLQATVLEHSPLAPLMQNFREELAAGGARADLATARVALGSFATLGFMDMAYSGVITGGGPSNKAEHEAWLRLGFQPYSAKIGDTWYRYDAIEPIGSLVSIAADVSTASLNEASNSPQDAYGMYAAMAMAAAHTLINKSYMQGVCDFVDAVHSGAPRGAAFFESAGIALVPFSSALGAVSRGNDPYVHAARGFVDKIRARLPGDKSDLAVKRDLWGRPVTYQDPGGVMRNLMNPINARTPNPEPIDQEMYNKLHDFIGMPSQKFAYPPGSGLVVDMEQNQKAYYRFVELAGNALPIRQYGNLGAKDYLNALVKGEVPQSRLYNRMTENGKFNMIQQIVNNYRAHAQRQVMQEFGDLQAQVELQKQQLKAQRQ